MEQRTLVAFGAERRMAAICLFQGSQLVGTRVRHLAVQPLKAADSIRALVARTLEDRRPDYLAIARPKVNCSARTLAIIASAKDAARDAGVPISEVDEGSLLRAYGFPPLRAKQRLREVGRTLWPGLTQSTSDRALVDAALAGLFIQVERLLAPGEVSG